MSVKSINPRAAALALSALIGGSVKPFANSYGGLFYMPIKVGSRSPITVYEAKRGDFDGDCEVIVALDTRPDAKEVVERARVSLAAFAAANGCEEAADPGDSRKRGWRMKCSQVVAACELPSPTQVPTASLLKSVVAVDEDAEIRALEAELAARKARKERIDALKAEIAALETVE